MPQPSAITLSSELIARLDSGSPVISIDQLSQASPTADPGRTLELISSVGEFISWGIADPENGVIRILARDIEDRPDDRFLINRVRNAMKLRQRLGLIPVDSSIKNAFRLIHGEGDGLSGFYSDVYGDFVIQYVLARGLREWGRRLAGAIASVAQELDLCTEEGTPWPRGVLQKVRGKGSARPGKPVQSVVHGEEPPEKLLVEDNGVRFEIHPLAGLNVGLFNDMREHRWRLGRFARNATVLNTFAYTCSLSVAAALNGAREVTSVDLSSGVLKWARENFRLAGLDADQHHFEVADISRFLQQAKKEGKLYDLVILDPPTYSAARASSWSMKRDLADMISKALALIPDGGILWFCGNSYQLSDQELTLRIAAGARNAGRCLALLESGGLPPDFPTPIAFKESRYLKLRIFRVGSSFF